MEAVRSNTSVSEEPQRQSSAEGCDRVGQGGATVAASEGRVIIIAIQNFYKVSCTCCTAFKSKVAKGEGDMTEWRLSLNHPAAVLIVWVLGREQWRGYSIKGAGEDVASTSFPEVGSEAPALSGRARLKSHKEAIS